MSYRPYTESVARAPYSPTQKLKKLIEQRARIVRTGAGLGVVLHAEHFGRFRPQDPHKCWSFKEECVTATLCGQALGIDGEGVVLRGDVHLFRTHVLHGMVRPVVSELELIGSAAQGLRQNLVAQADAHDREPGP